MNIEIVPAYNHPEEIKSLFLEYTDMLTEGDSSFKTYLDVQNYDDELENLEEKYGQPEGRLYLAYCEGQPAGCIGLRKIDEKNCEMKRLYVRPAYRKNGLGERLVRMIIDDAKSTGYSHMLLDTLPFLDAAVKMYEKTGFYITERYNDSPMSTSIFMKLDL